MSSAPPAAAAGSAPFLQLHPFAFRQFDDPGYRGTRVAMEKEEFERRVVEEVERLKSEGEVLVDGYAPFCKHIFIENFTDAVTTTEKITPENEHMLKTVYEARTEQELPVLVRYFPKEKFQPHKAKMLDLILYSREQLIKEASAMSRPTENITAPWGLISVKAQDEDFELPMNPITVMRNELISQGGSGVPIDRDAYMASVAYWQDHAIIA